MHKWYTIYHFLVEILKIKIMSTAADDMMIYLICDN